MDSNNQNVSSAQSGSLNYKELFFALLANWPWFVLAFVLGVGLAANKILRTQNVYERSAEVIIKSEHKGGSADLSSELSNLGLVGSTNSSVFNEERAFGTLDLMKDVVRRLGLDVTYYADGRFKDHLLYGKGAPYHIAFLDEMHGGVCAFDIRRKDGGCLELTEFNFRDAERKDRNMVVVGNFLDTLSTPVGRVVVLPTSYSAISEYPLVHVYKTTPTKAAHAFKKNFTSSHGSTKDWSDVITLKITDISTQRAEDILYTMIVAYNDKWIEDKNQITNSTSRFIDERLAMIEKELADVDSDISQYKSSNKLPDVNAAASMYMQQSNNITKQLQELENQLYMAKYIREYLGDPSYKTALIPAGAGLTAGGVDAQIKEYNDQLLKRNAIAANSSDRNALVVQMDASLERMREAIASSVDNQIVALQTQQDNLRRTEQQTQAQIAANPSQAKALLSVERQQGVKERLYLFLLQKREENQLSQAFTAYNTRVIEPPCGSDIPIEPQKSKILLIYVIICLLIPGGFFVARFMLDNKVHTKKDLEGLQVPFAGEVPLVFKTVKKGMRTRREPVNDTLVVKHGKRNSVNEAFRVLRTNIEFMGGGQGVIAVTSFHPGSGKTFISSNTSTAFSLKGKKVLVIDGDLRMTTLSKLFTDTKTGLSSYLNGDEPDWKSLLVKVEGNDCLDVLPVGTIPPNPAELLGSDRFSNLVEDARKVYDYVFIDCPPMGIVADTQVINRVVDRTIVVLRAGLFEKELIPQLQSDYDEGRIRNAATVLNCVATDGGRKYGYYRYGYGYGYGHSYGYGKTYGYTYGNDKDEE